MLRPAAVCHYVPDGQICCWFIKSDPSVFFVFIQTRFVLYIYIHLQVLLCRIYGLDLPTSSVITGMRGVRRASARRGDAYQVLHIYRPKLILY